MAQRRFPVPGSDGDEPDRTVPSLAEGRGRDGCDLWPEDDWDAAAAMDARIAQADAGLYELPADDDGMFVYLAEKADLAGFADGGQVQAMAPGPVLAALVHAAVGPGGKGLADLPEDQLFGVLAAARRLESRLAWTQMAVIGEFAARRARGPAGPAQFAADELAGELHMTWQSAAGQMAYASAVAERLPRTFAALAAGTIHPVHVRIIEDETRVLSDADAAKADEALAEAARSKTWAQLRYAAHRLVLKLDPDAAQRGKEKARGEAHVRRFREQSGNAGMIARELPPDEILASWQHVERRALDLRASGVPGTLRELRVRAYLDLLQERDSRDVPGGPVASQAAPKNNDEPYAPPGEDKGPAGNGGSRPDPHGRGPALPDRGGNVDPGKGPSIAALVNITVPWATLLGQSGVPGQASGFGLVDADTARDLVAAAARDPATRWCVTALYPDGTAAAHGCVPGRHPPPSLGESIVEFLSGLKVRFAPVIRGPCDHRQAEDGYRPSRTLQHLVRARNTRCTAPGCSRLAESCDLDHTTAWDKGGRTCPCGLAPLCRHHHRCKQAQGWSLKQPEPGVLVWRTPAGRTHVTTPTVYPL